MAFPKRLLIPGEELILDLRPHPIALFLPAVVTVAGIVAFVWLSNLIGNSWKWWLLALFVLLVAYPVRRLIWWLTSEFVVTTDRVVHREGFIAKRSMEIPLEAINDVRFEQGILDRMVGAGTLIISSASEFGRNDFDDIRHPEEVQKTIYEQGEANKKRMYQGGATAAGAQAQPPSAPSVTTELERLGRLRADGVLTEDEFQAQKARILGQG